MKHSVNGAKPGQGNSNDATDSNDMTLNNRIFIHKTALREHKRRAQWIGLFVLATTLSFALGHIIGQDGSRAPIIINRCGLTEGQISR